MKPLALDLFCGVGGSSAGLVRAGFRVIGVDKEPQPDYPYEFIRADAVTFLGDNRWERWFPEIKLVSASPPCQASSALTKGTNYGREYPQLIPQTRAVLNRTGIPYFIENVSGAPIRKDVTLCGEMFGLAVIRHRHFEITGWTARQPTHRTHRGRVAGMRHGQWYTGPYFAVYGDGGGKGTVPQWQNAMEIHWTNVRKSIAEAIPPAYTEYLGRQFLGMGTNDAR